MFTYTISPVNCEGSLDLDMKINGLSKSRNANKGPVFGDIWISACNSRSVTMLIIAF